MDNPYQAPKSNSPEPSASRHQSFRLTPVSTQPDANATIVTFREAIVFALVQQLPLLLLSAMLLDGGSVLKRVTIAAVAFWILTLLVMIRRNRNMLDSDMLAVKWGYLPLLLVTCIFWSVASAISF
jgi:hypothetical protein